MTLPTLPDLTLSEWAVLALIAEQPRHGFAIAKELGPDAEIGQIFTVPRPVVYRALAHLEEELLIYPRRTEPGDRGPARTLMATTDAGQAAVDRWLLTPVAHVRELRTHLLLQFRLLDRLVVRRGFDLV
jgi:PadR family transcriptional regulator AphA